MLMYGCMMDVWMLDDGWMDEVGRCRCNWYMEMSLVDVDVIGRCICHWQMLDDGWMDGWMDMDPPPLAAAREHGVSD